MANSKHHQSRVQASKKRNTGGGGSRYSDDIYLNPDMFSLNFTDRMFDTNRSRFMTRVRTSLRVPVSFVG